MKTNLNPTESLTVVIERIKQHVKYVSCVYAIIYVVICWIKWEIYNPLIDLMQIPNYTYEGRMFTLAGFFLIHALTSIFVPKK